MNPQIKQLLELTRDERMEFARAAMAVALQERDKGLESGLTQDEADKAAKKAMFHRAIDASVGTFIRQAQDDLATFEARGDSVKGIFLEKNLRATITSAFMLKKPELSWINGGLVPVSSSLPAGAESFDWQEIDTIGEATLISGGADDVAMADITGRSYNQKIHDYGIGYQYTNKQLRRAAMAGPVDFVATKGRAAREGMDLKLDKLVFEGDAITGSTGIINTPGTIRLDAATSNWATTATAAQIFTDFGTAYRTPINLTDGVERPDTAVLPIDVWARLMELSGSTASDKTVAELLMARYPGITRWEANFRMATADLARTGPALLLYKRSSDCIEGQMPFNMLPTPLQRQGFKHIQLFETAWGGLKITRPKSIVVMSNL